MGFSPVLLIGPFVAAVGVLSVIFVMRHRSVQTKSMYSARRQQIERKVRAARQRTLAPTSKSSNVTQASQAFTQPGMDAKMAAPTATWGPPTVRPEPPPPPPPEQQWEIGPTVPPPIAPPPIAPPPPEFTPSEPAYAPSPADTAWTPAPPGPVQPFEPVVPYEPASPPPPEPPRAPVETPMTTSAGGGASWSIVGETKAGVTEEPVTDKKAKKQKQTAAWQLASGELPGEEGAEDVRGPSTAVAVAQYAVLVVGLVMVLIGVLVMVANSHVT